MRKQIILLLAALMSVGAMAQRVITFHPGDEFKIDGQYLQKIDMPEDLQNNTLVEEIFAAGPMAKLVLYDNMRHLAFYLQEGDILYTWAKNGLTPRFTFYDSPAANRKYPIKHQYRVTRIDRNLIEFTEIE